MKLGLFSRLSIALIWWPLSWVILLSVCAVVLGWTATQSYDNSKAVLKIVLWMSPVVFIFANELKAAVVALTKYRAHADRGIQQEREK